MTYMIQLDISHEMTEAEVVADAAQFNCEATLLEEFGPAGGNPLYVFESESEEDLSTFACAVLCTDDQSWVESMIEEYE